MLHYSVCISVRQEKCHANVLTHYMLQTIEQTVQQQRCRSQQKRKAAISSPSRISDTNGLHSLLSLGPRSHKHNLFNALYLHSFVIIPGNRRFVQFWHLITGKLGRSNRLPDRATSSSSLVPCQTLNLPIPILPAQEIHAHGFSAERGWCMWFRCTLRRWSKLWHAETCTITTGTRSKQTKAIKKSRISKCPTETYDHVYGMIVLRSLATTGAM